MLGRKYSTSAEASAAGIPDTAGGTAERAAVARGARIQGVGTRSWWQQAGGAQGGAGPAGGIAALG